MEVISTELWLEIYNESLIIMSDGFLDRNQSEKTIQNGSYFS